MAWGRESRSGKLTRRKAGLTAYLINENYINGIDIGSVTDQLPSVGQTTCGVFAILGQPDRANQTTTAARLSTQLVYRSRGVYVYTEARPDDGNGIVRAIQH